MQLGHFSISLSVKDLAKSKAFYEALGFEMIAGSLDENWAMMRNGDTAIGLFHAMFEGNMLTFNPGWAREEEALDEFLDIRDIQDRLQAQGLTLHQSIDPNETGPAYLSLHDPDGNEIFIDQHVNKPNA